jgi:hypothetical protein
VKDLFWKVSNAFLQKILTKLYLQTEQQYRKNPVEAYKFFGRSDTSPSLAAMAVTANAMLNLDEVVTKE